MCPCARVPRWSDHPSSSLAGSRSRVSGFGRDSDNTHPRYLLSKLKRDLGAQDSHFDRVSSDMVIILFLLRCSHFSTEASIRIRKNESGFAWLNRREDCGWRSLLDPERELDSREKANASRGHYLLFPRLLHGGFAYHEIADATFRRDMQLSDLLVRHKVICLEAWHMCALLLITRDWSAVLNPTYQFLIVPRSILYASERSATG